MKLILTDEEIKKAKEKHDMICDIDLKLGLRDRQYSGNTVMGYRAQVAFEKYFDVIVGTNIVTDKKKIIGAPDYVSKVKKYKGQYMELKANGGYALKSKIFLFNIIKGYKKCRRHGVNILIGIVEVDDHHFKVIGWLPITKNIPKNYMRFGRGKRKAFCIPFSEFRPIREVAKRKKG